jgi:hypothetical protein
MKITPTSLTVSQLLGSQNEQYVIPAYQRRYSWKRHQVEDLWDDLEVLESADSHLFGTIVCLAGHHTAGINRLELVDGQQRLTTISILLHCLLDRLKAENEQAEVQDLGRLLEAKALGGQPQPKILLDSLDAKQFKRHASGDLSEPADNQRLLQGFGLLRERLAVLSLEKVGELLYRLKNQAVIIRLDVSEAKDAFKLFETINNRGLRLSATDIIKNFILGNAARFGAGSLDLARDKWAQLLTELDGIALDTFFRQYMMAHLRRRVTKSEVVEEFQKSFMREVQEADTLPERSHYSDLEDDDSDDEIEDVVESGEEADAENGDDEENDAAPTSVRVPFTVFLDALVRRAGIYRQLVLAATGVPALDRRLRNLRLIRAQPSYGFLMSLKAGGCTDKQFEEVLRLTESFLLRRHTTRERTNENETVFAQLCGANPQDPVREVRAVYREYCPSDERFKQEFIAATFPSRLMDRARYCLKQFELARQGTHTELLPGGPDIVHVEHIIPQKIKTKRSKKQFGDWVTYLGKDALTRHPHYVSRIGNLTLFAGELNIGASNNPYHRKKAAYLKSAFKLTQTLPSDYREFKFSHIEARSEAFADLALKIWPAI